MQELFDPFAESSLFGAVVKKFLVASLAVILMMSAPSQAQAQNVDWLVDIDDIVDGVNYDPTPAGGPVRLAIKVTNNGFGTAPATTVSFNVPVTFSLVGQSGDITGCTPVPATAGQSVTCNVPSLADSAFATVDLDFTSTQAQVLTLVASVPTAGESSGASSSNNSISETVTVTEGSDIGVIISTPPTVPSGSFFDYTVDIENFGPNTADSYRITVPVPTGVVNITPPAGCSLSGANYVCNINTPLAANGTTALTFNGQVSAAGGSDITAQTSVDNVTPGDPNPSNDQSTSTFSITAGTDAFITKNRSSANPLIEGDTATFTISTGYTGDAPTEATVTDTLPSNYTIQSVSATGGYACTSAPFTTQTISCVSPAGGSAGNNQSLGVITIVATANTESLGAPVINTAMLVTTGSPDSNSANNTASDNGVVIDAATVDLLAQKSGPEPAVTVVNDGATYDLDYDYSIGTSNIGNSGFTGTVILTDSVPTGMRITGLQQNGFTCLAGGAVPTFPIDGPETLVCSRDYTAGAPLAPNSTAVVGLDVEFTQPGTILNSMTVSTMNGNITEDTLGNNIAEYEVEAATGANSADLEVIKRIDGVESNPPNAIAGQPYTFDIEIVNKGPAPALDVEVLDTITNLQNGNDAFTFGYANTPAGSCSQDQSGSSSSRMICDIASIPACTAGSNCPVISVTVVPGRDAANRTNTASAESQSTAEIDDSDNEDSISYAVDRRVDMTVTKTAPASIGAGRDLSYVVTAVNENNGLSTAAGVTFTDTLPANVTFLGVNRTCSVMPAIGSVTGAASNNQLVCELGSIGNGQQRSTIVEIRPNFATQGTTITNNVRVDTTTTEIDLTNNTDSVDTVVDAPDVDILVNKSDDVDPLARSEFVTYTVTVTNAGPSASENIVVTDTWPVDKISFQSVTPQAGYSCSGIPASDTFGQTITCEIPYLEAGDSVDIEYVGRGDAKGASINNVAITSNEIAAGFDRESANNFTEENTTIRSRADLEVVSKVATPSTVNLNDDFDFVVTVRANTGTALFEADDVVFTDTLPSNMELVGTPVAVVTSGNATATDCSATSGLRDVSCDFGTMDAGTVIEVTIPVQVTSVTAYPETVSNTASIETSSQESDPDNNENTGSVIVNSSSIAGTVFRDFADDTMITAGDTRISGVTMTLTGESFDNPNPGTTNVTQTVTTDANGNFIFDHLPAGTYKITRGGVTEAFLVDGTNTAGNNAGTGTGTVVAGNMIEAINLPANTDNVENLFPVIPQARVGIAKDVTYGSNFADGSFSATFDLVVENFSLEPLINVAVTDQLSGGAPLFGSYVNLATPATDAMALGSYTILTGPSGSCATTNSGFDGNGDLVLSTGGALAIGGTCTLSFELRIRPTVAQLTSGFENQAQVTATGQISGQDETTNPQLVDLSDDGVQPDTDNDGQGNEAGENDPTPLVPTTEPGIALVKVADVSALSLPVAENDTVSYNFQIRNTGDTTLTNITVTENLIGAVVTGSIASLAPGDTDTTSITATYQVSQTEVDNGEVFNSASVAGTDPFGTIVTDDSGSNFTNDTTTRTALVEEPAVQIVKTIVGTNFQDPPQKDDVITYAFEITNIGNVTLSNVTVTDILPGLNLVGTPVASMAPGDVVDDAYTATYAITYDDIQNQEVRNRATVEGTAPDGTTVVDDESGPLAGLDEDTVQPITRVGTISLNKIADTSSVIDGAVVGDVIPFAFEITNTGNVPLDNVTITDALADFNLVGAAFDNLLPGDTNDTAWSGTYALKQTDIDATEVVNTADVTGTYGPTDAEIATDQDIEVASVGNIEAISEVFPPFTGNGGTTTSMLASDLLNNEPATLDTVTIMVLNADDGVTLDPTTALITLAPGYPAGEYTVEYKITSIEFPDLEDTAIETVVQGPLPAIEAVKTQAKTDNGDGWDSVGDVMTYTITLENTGNVPLTDVSLVDTLTDFNGDALDLDSGPTFVSADGGSSEGDLEIGEVATYTASFTFDLQAVNAGGIRNTVTGEGLGVYGPGVPGTPSIVTDVSDDDDDTDGNPDDDPTEYPIIGATNGLLGVSEVTGVSMAKTTPSTVVQRGDVVPYTITITNENLFTVGPADIVDTLPNGLIFIPGSATIGGAPADVVFTAGKVTWEDVTIAAGGDTVVTLDARVLNGARAGSLVNKAELLDSDTGGAITDDAFAVVQLLPEGVFDCTDVIGRVFDDVNGNGYQDAPAGVDRVSITDQTYDGGKKGAPPAPVVRNEVGIPGVRLAMVDGTIITTDENGLYSVPCAALAANSGSNFILKVDERSLPAGYRMTTENPRVTRATAGMMSEINFGATVGQVVRVDLNAAAFGANGAISAQLDTGLNGVLQQIANTPSTMVLAFHLSQQATSDDVATARDLLDTLEAHIKADWRDIGRVRLRIEHSIIRAGQ